MARFVTFLSMTVRKSPSSGTLPFNALVTVTLENLQQQQIRRMAAGLHVKLADGGTILGWRTGYLNMPAGSIHTSSLLQFLPNLAPLVGDNQILLRAVDVTPAPYNQPPYPPSGNTARDACTVTGVSNSDR